MGGQPFELQLPPDSNSIKKVSIKWVNQTAYDGQPDCCNYANFENVLSYPHRSIFCISGYVCVNKEKIVSKNVLMEKSKMEIVFIKIYSMRNIHTADWHFWIIWLFIIIVALILFIYEETIWTDLAPPKHTKLQNSMWNIISMAIWLQRTHRIPPSPPPFLPMECLQTKCKNCIYCSFRI